MNPLKWSIWVRTAVVVTVLWMVGGFAAWYGKSNPLGTDDILCFLFPVVLFWGIAWIVLPISDRKIRVRVIKILLIGILIVIVVTCALFTKKATEYTPPTSLAPQSSETPREIAPPAPFPYQDLPKGSSLNDLRQRHI